MIDEINISLNSGDYNYSPEGIKMLCESLRDVFELNLVIINCINDMEKWLLKSM